MKVARGLSWIADQKAEIKRWEQQPLLWSGSDLPTVTDAGPRVILWGSG